MLVHCCECGWEQEDFWTPESNPIRDVVRWEQALLDPAQMSAEVEPFSVWRAHGVTYRDVIIRELEIAIQRIEDHPFQTPSEAKNKPCPACGHTWSLAIEE
jgi:hypothetical protein